MATTDELRTALARVLWLGGPPDAGKTSVARALGERYGVRVYHLDRTWKTRFAHITAEEHPSIHAFLQMSMDERWVLRPPKAMAELLIASGPEEFATVVAEVRALLAEAEAPLVLVEGPWLFPVSVAPVISSSRQALWLLPTEDFKRVSAARRDKPASRYSTSDPERAARNWLARDLLIGAHIKREVRSRALPWLVVDGRRSLEETTALVAAHFAPLLPPDVERER